MDNFQYKEEPIIISRDMGHNILELLEPEYRERACEIVQSPDYVNSKYKLKKLFANIGIIVNPDAMTYVHVDDFLQV